MANEFQQAPQQGYQQPQQGYQQPQQPGFQQPQQQFDTLRGIQYGEIEDKHGWTTVVIE